MIDEILELGFSRVELGYDLRLDLVEGVKRRVEEGAIEVGSVHNFCPVPMGAGKGHPEIYTFAHADHKIRQGAVQHTARTLEFAAEVGARAVVIHCGYVKTRRSTNELIDLYRRGRQLTPAYEKRKFKFQMERDKKADRFMGWLYEGLEQLLPLALQHGIRLGLENMPTWEGVPSELEMEQIARDFGLEGLGYWHDLGHGQIRENLGLISHERWLERLLPLTVGVHVHDVGEGIIDHVMPPHGDHGLERFAYLAPMDHLIQVIEPTPRTPPEHISDALAYLKDKWQVAPTPSQEE